MTYDDEKKEETNTKIRPQFQTTKFLLSISVFIIWVLCSIQIVLLVRIRSEIYDVSLLANGTELGDLYLNDYFPIIFPILATLSCFLLLINFLACIGSATNNEVLLGWYFFVTLSTFCMEVSLQMWNIELHKMTFEPEDLNNMKVVMNGYKEHSRAPQWFVNSWTTIQEKHECCGVESFADWTGGLETMVTSCIKHYSTRSDRLKKMIEMPGCGDVIVDVLTDSRLMRSSAYVTIVMTVSQIFTLIFTLRLWIGICLKNPGAVMRRERVTSSFRRHQQQQQEQQRGCELRYADEMKYGDESSNYSQEEGDEVIVVQHVRR